jgi:hypothetical protein
MPETFYHPPINPEMKHIANFQEAHKRFLANLRYAQEVSRGRTMDRKEKRDIYFQLEEDNQKLLAAMRRSVHENKDNRKQLEVSERQMEVFEKMYDRLYKPLPYET